MDPVHAAATFLEDLAVVLGMGALSSVVCQGLRQPVVLGYLLAGLVVGPHFVVPLVSDVPTVRLLSELGVILLMFSLGLEFSIRKLLRVAPTAGVVTVMEVGLMLWLGYQAAHLLGWTPRECLFTAGMVAISSTMITAKVFQEQRLAARDGRLVELVFGVLVVEDLAAILLLALLTALAAGAGLTAREVALTAGRLLAFLVALVVVGLLSIPRVVRAVVALRRPETTLVVSVGLCFALALLAHRMGYSVALGAFLAGSLVAESGVGKQVETLVQPVRDMFAAIFFVSVGMLIDPVLIRAHWHAVAVLAAVVVLGKAVGVTFASFVVGHGVNRSLRAGLSLAQIGEFSFILGSVAVSTGSAREFLYPVAVAVSALTAFSAPWLFRLGPPLASLVDRKLPRPMQTFVALYSGWVERVRLGSPRPASGASRTRRILRLMLVDMACLVGLVVGTKVTLDHLVETLAGTTGVTVAVARGLVALGAGALSIPFIVGLFLATRALGLTLAAQAFPAPEAGKVDMAAAPRRVLSTALQMAILLAAGLPLLAVTQPFLPDARAGVVLLVPVLVLALMFWRHARHLHGHVRAGAQMLVEVLGQQGRASIPPGLAQVEQLLPGVGPLHMVAVEKDSPAVGRSLRDLNLRGLTGATVLAFVRGEHGAVVPTGHEPLQAGDVLALTGSRQAVAAARKVLAPPRGELA